MGVHRVSRSRKKVPIVGATTAESDKVFKVHEHRRERVAVRHALSSETEVPHPKSVSLISTTPSFAATLSGVNSVVDGDAIEVHG
jgi:hypothetical protein